MFDTQKGELEAICGRVVDESVATVLYIERDLNTGAAQAPQK